MMMNDGIDIEILMLAQKYLRICCASTVGWLKHPALMQPTPTKGVIANRQAERIPHHPLPCTKLEGNYDHGLASC